MPTPNSQVLPVAIAELLGPSPNGDPLVQHGDGGRNGFGQQVLDMDVSHGERAFLDMDVYIHSVLDCRDIIVMTRFRRDSRGERNFLKRTAVSEM